MASRSGRADHTHAAMPAMSGQAKLVPLPYERVPPVCRKNRGKAQKSRKRVCEFGKFIVPLQTNLKKGVYLRLFWYSGKLGNFLYHPKHESNKRPRGMSLSLYLCVWLWHIRRGRSLSVLVIKVFQGLRVENGQQILLHAFLLSMGLVGSRHPAKTHSCE